MAGAVARYKRDGYVVVKAFLTGPLLQRYRAELDSYVAEVIPTKSTEQHFFDGQWVSYAPPPSLLLVVFQPSSGFIDRELSRSNWP